MKKLKILDNFPIKTITVYSKKACEWGLVTEIDSFSFLIFEDLIFGGFFEDLIFGGFFEDFIGKIRFFIRFLTTHRKINFELKVLNKNLGYEWSVKRDEDCWYVCGKRGGSCSVCQINGDDGYCCSQTKLNLNGDCPTEAVNAMISSSDSVIEMHQCVRKISIGKWILSKIHRIPNSNNV